MTDSLVVNLDDLASTASTLKALCTAFDGSGDDADAVKPFLGSGELASAVHDFATDWKDHKKKLVGELQDAQQLAEQAHTAYITADHKLAQGLASNHIAPPRMQAR